ncbi:MAG: TetR family transcriptional regulator [Alphaproteobacteria bacterium]|nr:TetR family transcriptional regulator [Alphaproteobacteria bacterium]
MTIPSETLSPKESLRDAHKDLTRERILEAAIECLNDEELDQLTMEGVAAKAGVTKRTIYRHFATREELLKASWPVMQKMVGLPGTGNFVDSAEAMIALPLTLFPSFDGQAGAIRASTYSRAGRELRMAVNDRRKGSFLKAVKGARPDLDDAEALRLAATVQLLCSAFAWSVMRDFWGLSGEQSGRAVSDALEILLGPDRKPAGRKTARRASPTKKNAKPR